MQSYQIFLSYRRDTGENLAMLVRDRLEKKGYKVFLDVESLRSGKFNEQLYSVIENCNDFILLLTEDALNRCVDDGDWVRLEIEHAMQCHKNIVPVFGRNFVEPSNIPDLIHEALQFQGVTSNTEYFDAVIEKISMLCVSNIQDSNIAKIGKATSMGYGTTSGKCGDACTYSFDQDSGVLLISGSGQAKTTHEYVDTEDNKNIKFVSVFPFYDKITEVRTTDKVILDHHCFDSCPNLNTVVFGPGTVEIPDYAFYYCENLERIELPTSLSTIGQCAFMGCSKLKSFPFPSKIALTIKDLAFENCISLSKVHIQHKSYIGRSAFENCVGLKSVDIYCNSVKAFCFSRCVSLSEVRIRCGKIERNAFKECFSLKRPWIYASHIDAKAFKGCVQLQEIIFGSNSIYIDPRLQDGYLALQYTPGEVLKGINTLIKKIDSYLENNIEQQYSNMQDILTDISWSEIIRAVGREWIPETSFFCWCENLSEAIADSLSIMTLEKLWDFIKTYCDRDNSNWTYNCYLMARLVSEGILNQKSQWQKDFSEFFESKTGSQLSEFVSEEYDVTDLIDIYYEYMKRPNI